MQWKTSKSGLRSNPTRKTRNPAYHEYMLGCHRITKEEVVLPSKAACTPLLVRFWLTGRTEETVKGPPVEDGGLVRLIERQAVASSPRWQQPRRKGEIGSARMGTIRSGGTASGVADNVFSPTSPLGNRRSRRLLAFANTAVGGGKIGERTGLLLSQRRKRLEMAMQMEIGSDLAATGRGLSPTTVRRFRGGLRLQMDQSCILHV